MKRMFSQCYRARNEMLAKIDRINKTIFFSCKNPEIYRGILIETSQNPDNNRRCLASIFFLMFSIADTDIHHLSS